MEFRSQQTSPLLQEIVPKKYRATAVACSTFISSFAFIGGPVIQGLCIQQGVGGELDGWRVGFYIGAGIWAVTGVCLLAFYHPMPRPNPEKVSVARRIKRLDWLGIFLVSAGVTLFLVGLQYGDNLYPWTSSIVLGTLIPGAILCILFCLWEWKGTATGIIPHALFHDKKLCSRNVRPRCWRNGPLWGAGVSAPGRRERLWHRRAADLRVATAPLHQFRGRSTLNLYSSTN
jgi:MFS family permease